jgi:hypothetical protein
VLAFPQGIVGAVAALFERIRPRQAGDSGARQAGDGGTRLPGDSGPSAAVPDRIPADRGAAG